MLTVALTGGIGSGKTAVTQLFQEIASKSDCQNKLSIIDADIIARNLLAGSLNAPPSNQPAYLALKEVNTLFGTDLFDSNGYLDRSKLRSLIFSSEEKKQQLEALLHPLVYDEIFSQISAIHSGIIIVSIPLLLETKAETRTEKNFDRILVIDIPVELQIKRSSKRDNCSPELIKKIINSQIERNSRLSQADDIINNSGTVLELRLKVESIFNQYCTMAAN
jgi:dephospho-CoA kinase